MKVVIIGGVAGGATAAARIRRLDEQAEIIIFERSGYISYANCGLPYYIGGVIEDKFVFGNVSNSLSVGGMIKLPEGEVKFNDGKFEVILVRNFKAYKLLPIMHKVINQKYDGKEIIYFTTKKIKFTALEEDVPWTIDGEFAGSLTDIDINNCNNAISLVTPESEFLL